MFCNFTLVLLLRAFFIFILAMEIVSLDEDVKKIGCFTKISRLLRYSTQIFLTRKHMRRWETAAGQVCKSRDAEEMDQWSIRPDTAKPTGKIIFKVN